MLSALLAIVAPAVAPVEVPFRIADDAIVVDVELNGRKGTLMFDTGFSGTAVVGDSLNLGQSTGTVQLRDFVGAFEAKTTKLTSLKVAGHPLPSDGLEAVQIPGGRYTESYGTHVDGILGFEGMSREVFEINFERRTFVFHPDSMDISQRKPDGERTFLLRMLPKGHNAIELSAELDDGQKLYLALDTGNAFYATTHKDVLERVGLWKPGRKPDHMGMSMVASGPVGSFYVQMPPMAIFGVPVQESVWSIIDLPSSSAEHDGTVGFGFLKNFNIIVDTKRRRVWLENFSGSVSEAPSAGVGLLAAYDPSRSRMRVVSVTPGGPAEAAGVQRGDDLLAVGGKEVVQLGWRTMDGMLRGEPGSKIEVAFSRAGNLRRVELERKVLVNLVGRQASR
jgi:hypothetical protein